MTLNLTKRLEVGVPLNMLQHDDNLTAIEDAVNSTRANNTVTPEDFDLGSDGLNIAASINEGIANGVTVRIDRDYFVSSAIPVFTFSGQERLNVVGQGKILVTASFILPAVSFFAPHSAPTSVSAISLTTRVFPGNTTSTPSSTTKITSAGHACAIGNIIKIFSDDQIVGSTSSARQVGEFAYVADVSGNDIYVPGALLNTYTTSPKICKVNTAPKLIWDGPTFAATPGQSSWTTIFMRVRGFYQPEVKTGAHDGYNSVLEISSCVHADVDVSFRNLRNRVDEAIPVAGYCVQDTASFQSRVRVNGADARHAYTTITPSSSPGDDPYLYGQTASPIVTGSVFGNSAAAFDCHTEGTDVSFINCVTTSTRYGQTSSGGGFGLRGQRTRVINGQDRGSQQGAQFWADTVGDGTDCELVNYSYIGPGKPVTIGNLSTSSTITRPKIRGGYLRSSHPTEVGVSAFKCVGGIIEDLLIAPSGSGSGTGGILLGGNAELLIRNVKFDLSGYTGSTFRAFQFSSGSTGNKLTVEGATIINGTGKLQSWFHGQSTSGSMAILGGLKSDAQATVFYQGHGSLDLFRLEDGWSVAGSWVYSSDVPFVEFTSLGYDELRVVARNVTKSLSHLLNVRLSVTNGSSYITTSDYITIAADGQETTATFVSLHDTAATAARSGMVSFAGLKGSGEKQYVANNRLTTGIVNNTGIVNAIRILPGSGNLTGGSITVFGR